MTPEHDPTPPRRPVLRSLLPRSLRWLLGLGLVLAAFMLANTLYLLLNRLADALGLEVFAVGETSLPALFQAMVLTHTGVGLLLVVVMLVFFLAHLPKVWARRHTTSIVSGVVFVVAGLVLVVTGLFILTAAASEENRWAWWLHVAAGLLVPAGYVAHRMVSYTRPPSSRYRRFAAAVGGVALLLVTAHAFTRTEIQLTPEAQAAREGGLPEGPGAAGRDVSDFYPEAGYVPEAWVPPASPFFPSAATTSTGSFLPLRLVTRHEPEDGPERRARELERYGFVAETPIGAESCVRCHQDVVAQWEASAHRFASFNNPFYEATIRDLRENHDRSNPAVRRHLAEYGMEEEAVGRIKSQWCAGCHDPALLFTGTMRGDVDRNDREAQAGLTCLACHAIDRIHGPTGNGNYNIADEQEDPYLFGDAPEGSWREALHDAALRAKPTVHKRQMMKPFFQDAEFCATCHKVSLQPPVNDYRWLRGQDEYDNWHDSGVARNAARTFYLPPAARVCQDCHMPPEPAPLGDLAADDGMVRSHRFVAVNTALPYVRGDTATIRRIESFLRSEKLRVEVFALRRPGADTTVTELDRTRPELSPGERVRLDVVVRNQGVGHTFPGGTNDSNEGWLQVTISDPEGRTLAVSGALGPDGHLDPEAHAFKAVILDRNGEPIHRRNAQDIYVTAAANVIGPGTVDIGHYELAVPREMAGRTLTVRARLLWRKFDRRYTEFAYETNPEGFRRFLHVPDLPVTEIASDEVRLPVAGPGVEPEDAPGDGAGDTPLWVRYNDYGIGLLLQGSTREARPAFRAVEALAPDRIDGPLNLARTALRDGNLEEAYGHLERVEEIEPANARAAWVWGSVLQEDGRYDDAEAAYRRVLEEFPDDRATWRNLGRTYYLAGRYEDALGALHRVLSIDPEDRIAHYHRMLALRALGRGEHAERAAEAWEHYSVDESATAVAREFLRANPGVNLMSQPIHTHALEPPAREGGEDVALGDGAEEADRGPGAADGTARDRTPAPEGSP